MGGEASKARPGAAPGIPGTQLSAQGTARVPWNVSAPGVRCGDRGGKAGALGRFALVPPSAQLAPSAASWEQLPPEALFPGPGKQPLIREGVFLFPGTPISVVLQAEVAFTGRQGHDVSSVCLLGRGLPPNRPPQGLGPGCRGCWRQAHLLGVSGHHGHPQRLV